ncbi:BZ3500_MvSof-1268-A1-R1_Chr5-2g07781 [Microbotryum saponariae]|uniref:BZ3500_MvSof-1268-A1-R1_Chr5-2g07781 protein n=1 Tax=Microbotryum saponariae TaxID=289078 RepID=A0A2X0LK91_9BASI|nr:BZ3500_MvSof-1268-A1-R1_Chr5-2g07781 [Microbotryum saponariae]SDA05650.1 BZ3501_MvSof-1269-A2-R1_Chr5-2g07603 [Microbotryum saponariae]
MTWTAMTYPLVNLSTRSQVAAREEGQSTRAAALKVIKEDGIVGLYDGLSSSLLGIAITNGFEETRAYVMRARKDPRKALSTIESILTSAIAGAATSVFSNPIWVVNTRQTVRTTVKADPSLPTLQSKKIVVEKKLNVIQTIMHIINTDGFGAFFHGLGPALILVSNPILQFTHTELRDVMQLFEQLKNIILARRATRLAKGAGASPLTDLDFFLLGAVSKLFATSMTYPYLTVKARMQAGHAEGRSYTSSFDGLRKIIKKDGVAGLYQGVAPKLIQSVTTAAILFLAKEKIYQASVKAMSTVTKV